MNFTTLRPLPPPQVQQVSKEGEEKDAEYLLLRLLNKRSRVRVSPKPLPLEKGRSILFAVANETKLFAAVTANEAGQFGLSVSPLSSLRSAFATTPPAEGAIPLTPQRSTALPGSPTAITFAFHGQRILLGLKDGQILMYDAAALDSPLHVFPAPTSAAPRDILPNPEGIPELAAVMYDTDGSAGTPAVQVLDVQQKQSVGGWFNGGSPETTPTAISWSPKGKQLALGLLSGDIVTFSPTDAATIKTFVPRPTALPNQSLISLSWLSNSDFHAIYVPSAPLTAESPQTHLILSIDSKANTCTVVKISAPCSPYPGLCIPGSFSTVLRQWSPTKFLIFVGDSSSSDIGLIGAESTGSDLWSKLNLEETSTPTVPLDEDMSDTVLMGLAVDLSGTEPFSYKTVSGEDAEAPPPPVLLAYASDGTVVGWHVVNTGNNPYPGMMAAPSPTPVSQSGSMDSMKSNPETTPSQAPPSVFSQPSSFGQTTGATSAFGQSSFSQTSTSAFGQGSFGQPSAFGQPSLGGASTSTFGQSSFGGAPKAGFGAFASGGPSAWGSSGPSAFSSNALAPSTSTQSTASPMAVSNSTSGEEPMASDNNMSDTGLGGLSLGGGDGMDVTRPNTGRGTDSVFGAAQPPKPAEEAKPTSSFGAFSGLKPAVGFGASNTSTGAFGSGGAFSSGSSTFGGSGSAFGSTPSTSGPAATDTTKPASGFGTTGFGATSSGPAFGQSSFGQTSFGKPSLGQASFGTTGFGAKPAAPSAFSSTGGGFSAFASGGTSGFGISKDASAGAKPVWAATSAEKKPEASSGLGSTTGGGFSAFAQGGSSAFGAPKTTPPEEHKKPQASGSGFGGFAPSSPSPFGLPNKPSDVTPKVEGAAEPSTSQSPFGGVGSSVFGSSLPPKPPTTLDRDPERSTTPPTPSSDAPALSTPSSPVPVAATPTKDATKTPIASPFSNSPFKSSTPGPSTGAFSNLVSNPVGFSKLDSGFGAFGGVINTSSPFFNAQKPTGTASPFGGGASTTASTTPKSTFGTQTTSTSAFGQTTPASAFGKATPVSAFGAPSPLGGTSGSVFGKPAFTTTPTTTPPATKVVTSAFSAFSTTPSGFSAFSGGGESSKSFSDLLRQSKDSPEPVKTSSKAPAQQEEEPLEYGDDEEQEQDEDGEGDEDETSSFLSQSFSDQSVPEEEDQEEPEEPEPEEPEPDELSESPGETPRPDLPSDQEEEEAVSANVSTPSIQLTSPSPPATPDKGKGKAREVSTTPPGSPVGQSSSSAQSASFVAAPIPVTPGTGPFGVGLGRPSTRPSRSSPLASAPISGDDEEATSTPKLSADKAVTQVPSPEPSSGDDASPLTTRSKTPPSLSSTTPPPKLGVFSVPSSGPSSSATPQQVGASPSPESTSKGSIFAGSFTGFSPKVPSPSTTPPVVTPPTKASIFPGGFSGFGQKPVSPSPPLATQGSVFTPPPDKSRSTTPPTGIFPPKLPPTPSATGLFGGGNGFALPTKPANTPSIFTPSSFPSATPASTPPLSLPTGLNFGQKAGPVPPSQATPSSSTQVQASRAVPQAAPPAEPQEQLDGMQKAYLAMYNLAEQELKNIKLMADDAAKRRAEYGKPMKISRTKDDLGDANKWAIGDVHEFARIMKSLEKDVAELKEIKGGHVKSIRELESSLLRATTRKEEIIRFDKASTDAEFAKLLKSRTLGPEHLETQTQLRRQIRVIRDRVQTLEDHLQAAKKRLNQFKTGKPAVRAPSLDTINRTYRNIDLAISQQAHDVAQLSTRVSKLKIDERRKSTSLAKSKGERRMPEDSIFAPSGRSKSTPPRDVTPNVAATTAAALNAERAAQKLKKALLSVRREPLLNTQAADARSVPVDFKTPHKPSTGSEAGPSTLSFNLDNISFPTLGQTPAAQTSSWTLPPFDINQSPDSPSPAEPAHARHRVHSGGSKYHQRAVPLKKAPGTPVTQGAPSASPSPVTTFDWGPLPGVKPKSTISVFDIGK
ncbi:hypothetical protein BXZ70DRAFT_947463 [Cristinia sonorae]|uniref:Nucleoporin Nup159/Nup146 N-terminal domain-containing protein n=1 Tax=Cristinia sonorae TaxID=1940300 RepID=A0A8K0XN95_9AGAR|nr:hypothetical protein BXZ70DRAFT_947463 [Cristinia sonorae]